MRYCESYPIPQNGILELKSIGGSPHVSGTNQQIGINNPPRAGIISITSQQDDENIHNCEVVINAYFGKPISRSRCPARVVTELPCNVSVSGPVGTQVIVEAWELFAFADKGASLSFLTPEAGIRIPQWATSFDLATPGIATFRDSSGAVVGVVTGSVVGFSIPTRAFTVDVASALANNPIVFRQLG